MSRRVPLLPRAESPSLSAGAVYNTTSPMAEAPSRKRGPRDPKRGHRSTTWRIHNRSQNYDPMLFSVLCLQFVRFSIQLWILTFLVWIRTLDPLREIAGYDTTLTASCCLPLPGLIKSEEIWPNELVSVSLSDAELAGIACAPTRMCERECLFTMFRRTCATLHTACLRFRSTS